MKYPKECKSIWGEAKTKETNKPKALRAHPQGDGACPVCGGKTILRGGKYGKFYGCKSFPACRGSRNYE